MSERLRQAIATVVTVGLAAFVVLGVVTAPPRSLDRAQAIGERIRCPVCQGESIAESPAELATDMMALVNEKVEEGWSDRQIVALFTSSYGEGILLDPPWQGVNLVLWLLPFVALVVGAVVVLGRRRRDRGSIDV